MIRRVEYDDEEEDVIVIHLGRVVSDELFDEIVGSVVNLLELKYPLDKNWNVQS